MPSTRVLLAATALYCLALVGIALYLQHSDWYLLPCPLCVIQRYAYLGIALFCAIGASVRKPLPWLALAGASALGGIGTVAKHLYVLAHPGFSCGIDPVETMLNKIPTATALPWLFRADGMCENATQAVLGLSVPQWSALGFAGAALLLVLAFMRSRRP
jgi:disulfide bond formation protein DsbB